MGAPKGNRFWEARSSHGRKPKFETPTHLWEAACEYFKWVEDNPLEEQKIFHAQGVITKDTIYKMRAMTNQGLCLFLDISRQNLDEYERRKDYSDIVKHIKAVIYEQKFTGASADLLNSNIIARDLGLTDKRDVNHSGSISDMSEEEIDKRLEALIANGKSNESAES